MIYRFGACLFDPLRHRLLRAGQPIHLRAKAFEVLRYLLEQRDRTVLKAELCETIWPQHFISDATLESTVRAARQALGDSGRAQQLIQTVHGYGYRFVAAVEMLADAPFEIDAMGLGIVKDAATVPLREVLGSTSLQPAPAPASQPETFKEERNRPSEPDRPSSENSKPPGEWKLVTILCCALATPSNWRGHQDAESRYVLLSHLYTLARPVMQRYGGTLQPVIGDHLLAVFGIPVVQEDHAQRAVLAALDLQRRRGSANERDSTFQGGAPVLGIGLSTGQVAVGHIGADPAALPVMVGDTVLQAITLQTRAAPGTILCADSTARLVQGSVRVEAIESVAATDESIPMPAYRVLGPYVRPGLLDQGGPRLLTPFVGRQRELETLHALATSVGAGQGQVVGIIGEPGVGKSRSCYEFLRDARLAQWRIQETRGSAYSQATPYQPIIDLLKSSFHLDDRDDPPTVHDKVKTTLHDLDEALTSSTPALLALFDVPVETPCWQGLDAPQRRQRVLDAVRHLLLRESQLQPLLLVIENLHWIDSETQALLDRLVESLPTARILLLLSYRPEYRHDWGHKTYYTQLRLDPLPRDSTRALLDALLGEDMSLQSLKPHVIIWTEGNPFFVEESVRMLVETHALTGERGAYRLARVTPTLQVPATVQAVLAARIDGLPAAEKHLLQTAAVIGTEVPFSVLQAVAALPEAELCCHLARLQGAEFFYERRLLPEIEYTFKHALTHQVAYETLFLEQRKVLHARIVGALEATAGGRLAGQADRLAHHAIRGEVWHSALVYCQQMGEKAMVRSAYREAVAAFEQALGALQHLPETRTTREQAIDLRLALRSALYPLGDQERILAYLREAESLAISLEDPHRLGQVSIFLFNQFLRRGAYDQAVAVAQRTFALATAGGDIALQGLANLRLGYAYHAQGDYRRAIDCYGKTLAAFDGARRPERFGMVYLPAVDCRAYLAVCHAELGMFAEGRSLGEEGLGIANVVDHPGSLMFATWGIGVLSLRQGGLARALPLLERAVGLCHEADLPAYFPLVASSLGAAYSQAGRVADALPLLTQAMEQVSVTAARAWQARCYLPLGEAQMLAGYMDEAKALAEQALVIARAHREQGHEAYALRLLGDLTARRDPPAATEVVAYYRQAMALAERLGMRPLQAHCQRGLGTLYAKIGRREQACAELTAAIGLYRAMEMTFWLPEVEGLLEGMTG